MARSFPANPGKRPLGEAGLTADERPLKQAAIGAPHVDIVGELFDGTPREAYLARHVHKKLHTQAAGLSDEDLHRLGKLTFNQQFERFEPLANSEMIKNGDIFGGISRDEYLHGRVHRRLHPRVGDLSDMELLELGKMSFNQQFQYFGEGPPPSGGYPATSSPQQGQGSLFGGMTRTQYVEQRIHRKWHARTADLSDQELAEIGKLSFNEQFPVFEQMAHQPSRAKQATVADFGVGGRDGYMTSRIHRKLHSVAACLSDQDLLELGKLSFNDQFPTIEKMLPGVQVDGAQAHDASTATMQPGAAIQFGAGGREAFLQQRVHRKLHAHAALLSDQDLSELGKLSFNDQFPFLGMDDAAGAAHGSQSNLSQNGGLFKGLTRDAYLKQRVHRRLLHLATSLSDQGLYDLGQLSFKEQFPVLGQDPGQMDAAGDEATQETLLFDGMAKEAYIEQHIHRKLHSHAMTLPDDDLHALGKLSFNEQFPLLGLDEGKGAGKGAGKGGPRGVFNDAADRQGYIERRIHRKLHAHVARLSDQELLDFGRRSFNEQFEVAGVSSQQDGPNEEGFGGLSRDQYMQQRVHRKLHAKAASLRDNELLELGKLSFNDQFPFLEQFAEICRSDGLDGQNDAFDGLSRESYMNARIHRRLHAEAANLSDQDLAEIGKLSFNEQFPRIQAMQSTDVRASEESSEAFGGLGREEFLQRKVHRRLHSQAAGMGDQELAELGQLSFNQQFVKLGHAAL